MLDSFKSLFSDDAHLSLLQVLNATQQIVSFLEQKLEDKDKLNASLDHLKSILDGHKK